MREREREGEGGRGREREREREGGREKGDKKGQLKVYTCEE